MEQKLSDILDNILSLLLLEGSYEIEETDDSFLVEIETRETGRLIGTKGESLDALQLIVNQALTRVSDENYKRVILDVSGWKKQKEEELFKSAKEFGNQVLETGKEMELEVQPAWQRRIVHTAIGEMEGLETESLGEGRDRRVIIKLKTQKSKLDKEIQKEDAETEES